MQRKWVVVAFGDIRGFTAWTRRGANTPEIREPFIQRFYAEMEKFVRENADVHFKYLGDGMMVLKELPDEGHQCASVRDFLQSLLNFTRRIVRIVRECRWPPPEGFRMRVVTGHVGKLEVIDGRHSPRDRRQAEYVGYAINLAERLLSVKPDTICICHESVVKILGPKKTGFKFKKLGPEQERRKGVDQEDLEALWHLQL